MGQNLVIDPVPYWCGHMFEAKCLLPARTPCAVLLVLAGLHVLESADSILKIFHVPSTAVHAVLPEADTAPKAAVQGRQKTCCCLLLALSRSSTRARCAAGEKCVELLSALQWFKFHISIYSRVFVWHTLTRATLYDCQWVTVIRTAVAWLSHCVRLGQFRVVVHFQQ